MKALITIIFTILMNQAFAQVLPQCWFKDQSCDTANKNNAYLKSIKKSQLQLQHIMDVNSDMVENSATKQNEKTKWYLQSIKTELGIETSGEVGILGFGGETAIELIWIRNLDSSSIKSPVKAEENQADFSIDENWDEDQTDLNVSQIADFLEKSGQLKNKESFKQEIAPYISQIQMAGKSINNVASKKNTQWQPYKYQIELNVETTGRVTPIIEVGAGFRLRLEWSLNSKKKLNKENSNAYDINNDFLVALASDLEELSLLTVSKTKYTLDNLKIGMGIGVKGDLFIAKTKASVIGSLFFKRIEKSDKVITQNISLQELPFMNATLRHDKGFSTAITSLNRQAFRNGLSKVTSMAHFFAKAAVSREEKILAKGQKPAFDLKYIELELELYASGELSLATLQGISVIELFFTKHNL